MATGFVLDIDATSGNSGHVQVDETLEILYFKDGNFPTTGLKVKDKCTFDILQNVPNIDPNGPTDMATNLQPLVVPSPPPTNITGPYKGDLTANVGDVITVTGTSAVVAGNIIINGGKVIVEQGAQVNATASHQISKDGVFVARKGGQVNGNININTGGNLKVINKGNVVGNINVNQAGRIMIGNQNGPGFVTGTLDIQGMRGMQVTPDSKITS